MKKQPWPVLDENGLVKIIGLKFNDRERAGFGRPADRIREDIGRLP